MQFHSTSTSAQEVIAVDQKKLHYSDARYDTLIFFSFLRGMQGNELHIQACLSPLCCVSISLCGIFLKSATPCSQEKDFITCSRGQFTLIHKGCKTKKNNPWGGYKVGLHNNILFSCGNVPFPSREDCKKLKLMYLTRKWVGKKYQIHIRLLMAYEYKATLFWTFLCLFISLKLFPYSSFQKAFWVVCFNPVQYIKSFKIQLPKCLLLKTEFSLIHWGLAE